ncbi:MAG: peptide chain release factor-like protein [Phycisphaerae bacterium]|nr:peptide chain release factor-like protein [Phycisphaerae bacterium]
MKTHKNKKPVRTKDLLPPLSAFEPTGHLMIEGEHPAMLDDETLLKNVIFDFGRTSGPGGQHRNRKATACTATHLPTDISGEASERRRQSENRKMSISRLRRTLAIRLRSTIAIDAFKASLLWEERRNGDQLGINPKHRDYPCILAEALDVVFACDFNMPTAAEKLQISATQLLKIVAHDNAAITWLNEQRKERGLSALQT